MAGPLSTYLANDHDRLDRLMEKALAVPGTVDRDTYGEFRRGLLRHIGIEEKLVLPASARLQNGRQAEVAGRIRLDHGAIVALLVPPPLPAVIATLRSILDVHNALEEGEHGLYQLLDELAGAETEKLLAEMQSTPEVPVVPHNERPGIIEVTRRAVERAGYVFREGPP